ncbi:ATP-binding protein [Actinoplanes sp. NPDC051851]|uniref:PAS domain-containing sensor histidine kinase n=1 Tax=Actinoplanes sp. NPDC051851 TaxID=3154753 RepID=UPI00342D0AE7
MDRARRVLMSDGLPLDEVARLAADLLGAPTATITLIGDAQERVLGAHGPQTGDGPLTPIAETFGGYLIGAGHALYAGDTTIDGDPRVREHPLTRAGIRALAAVPLCDAENRPVGAFTVLDTRPRYWGDPEVTMLTSVAGLVTTVISREISTAATFDSEQLLDSVQEAFLAVDVDGRIRVFNRAAQELLGFTSDEVYDRHLDDTLQPHYGDQPIAAALERLFTARPRRPVQRAVSVRRVDGSRLDTRAALSVIRSAAGPLACVLLTDLSAQTAAEDAADRHRSFLTALLDSLSVGVIACDDTGRPIVINRALREVHHLPDDDRILDDIPVTTTGVLFDTAMRPLSWEETPLMRAYRGEHLTDADIVVHTGDAPTRTFTTNGQPIIGRDGRQLGAVVAAHEVTALRRAQRFRDCHRRVEEILHGAPSIGQGAPELLRAVAGTLGWPYAELFVVESATGQLRAVGHHCDGDEPDGFFGHTPIHGLGITGTVWETGQPLWVADVSEGEDPGTEYERERAAVYARHGVRTILAVPVRDGGTLLGVLTCYAGSPEVGEDLLTVLLDGVAAQIGVYLALRRAEEFARQLARAQDDFVELIGHELRTPLTSINANVTIIADEAADLDPELRQMLETVARNTGVLQKLVDTLLDLAGLESGHDKLDITRIDLAAVVSDSLAAARAAATDRGVLLHAHLDDQLLLDGDGRRLRQLVDDLLSNAVKYSAAGGSVDLHLRLHGATAELTITDRGIGIPTDERPSAFARFYRASNVRHQGVPGSGLGLSLARAIVGLHHGTLTLDDNEPTGTIARVRLPLPG